MLYVHRKEKGYQIICLWRFRTPSRSGSLREIRGAVAMGRRGCLWFRGDQCLPRITGVFHGFSHDIREVSCEVSLKHPVKGLGKIIWNILELFLVGWLGWFVFFGSGWRWLNDFLGTGIPESLCLAVNMRKNMWISQFPIDFCANRCIVQCTKRLCRLVTGEFFAWRFINISCHSMFVNVDGSRWSYSLSHELALGGCSRA